MIVKFTAKLIDNNPEYLIKQQLACEILNEVWNSDEFKDNILNKSMNIQSGWWRWKKFTVVKKFSSTSDSNEKVYEKLMSVPNPVITQDIVYCRNKNVIGYEDGTDISKVCNGWDEYLDVYGVVENMAHEFCHKMGYSHVSARDSDSVPYSVGVIAGYIARKIRPNL